MGEAVKLYQEFGFPALDKGGHAKNLVGYFRATLAPSISSSISGNSTTTPIGAATGPPSSPIPPSVDGFAVKFRPLVMSQEVKLLNAAPWARIRK